MSPAFRLPHNARRNMERKNVQWLCSIKTVLNGWPREKKYFLTYKELIKGENKVFIHLGTYKFTHVLEISSKLNSQGKSLISWGLH